MKTMRWKRVIIASASLTLCGMMGIFIYLILTDTIPMQCIDDLSDLTNIAENQYKQGNTTPLVKEMYYDSNTNKWCYFDEVD
jgi:hypothetical protein